METIFDQLWKYTDWANNKLFDAFEHHGRQIPAQCLHLLSHIVNSQAVWLGRVSGEPAQVAIWQDHDLDGCKLLHQQTMAGIRALMETDMDRSIHYTNQQGNSYNNYVSDILLHLFNHGTYHRAQIAHEMRVQGLEPVNTDYINFIRLN